MTGQTRRPWRAVVVEQDVDESGRSFARAGIQTLMELMCQGVITTIVTYRFGRFGRNLQQAFAHLEEVEALGGQVVSVTEPMDVRTRWTARAARRRSGSCGMVWVSARSSS